MLNMNNAELAKLLTDLFNKEKQDVITWEDEVQCGYDYSLEISTDGIKGQYREFFDEKEILNLLNSGVGYISGQSSVDGHCSGRDIYRVGTTYIYHASREGDSQSLIEEYAKRKI